MNFTFNLSGKIRNCSLNLPFLHPHATISSKNSRFVYLINVTADQPLSENSKARGGVVGGLIVIRYSDVCLKSFSTPSLNSEGMLRGTDNFHFTLITFSFKLELVLINRVINIFLTVVPIWYFCLSSVVWYLHLGWSNRCNKRSFHMLTN